MPETRRPLVIVDGEPRELPEGDTLSTSTPLSDAMPLPLGAAAAGASTLASHADHVHAHGAQPGGTQHALADDSLAGFIAAGERSLLAASVTKLLGIEAGAQVTSFAHVAAALAVAASDLVFNARRLTGVADPIASQDAATKAYVDLVAQGFDPKPSCRVATTGNVNLTPGSCPTSVDGRTLALDDRILVKSQTNAAQNCIYRVSSLGAGTNTATWVRANDANTDAKVTAGLFTWVTDGATLKNTGWILATEDPIVLGTTLLVFEQFSAISSTIAGNGLSKTGNTLAVVPANVSITSSPSGVAVAAPSGTPTAIGVTAGSAGGGPRAAYEDHSHPAALATTSVAGLMSAADKTKVDASAALSTSTPAAIAAAGSAGAATTASPSSHTHAHGAQAIGDGTMHAVATTLIAGFMSATDKTKLDTLPVPAPFLLSGLPTARGAFSVSHRLSSTYYGPLFRVRRSNDNAETDIGADDTNRCNTAALAAFCGAAQGYVSLWYNQSGNTWNLPQPTAASQPQIYDGTNAIRDEVGNVAMSFDAANDHFAYNGGTGFDSSTAITAAVMHTPSADAGSHTLWWVGAWNAHFMHNVQSYAPSIQSYSGTMTFPAQASGLRYETVQSPGSSTSVTLRVNGAAVSSSGGAIAKSIATEWFMVGTNTVGTGFINGKMSTLTVWNVALDTTQLGAVERWMTERRAGIQGAGTSISLSSATPQPLGAASAGVATNAAKGDHVHAHGAQAIGDGTNHALANDTYAGFIAAGERTKLAGIEVGAQVVSAVRVLAALAAAAADISVNSRKITSLATPTAGNDAANKTYVDTAITAAGGGGGVTYATSTQPVGNASAGSAANVSRGDHVHAHGNQGGGSQHSLADDSVAGFVAAGERSKLAGIEVGAQVVSVARVLAAVAAASSAISVNSQRITALANPVNAQDAATRAYVDAAAAGGTGVSLASTAPVSVTASASATGSGTTAARADHQHFHGNLVGSTLHDVATQSVNGFLSAADKTKLDGLNAPAAFTVISTAGDYNVVGGGTYIVTATNGHVTFTLPTAAAWGYQPITIKRVSAGAYQVTVYANGATLIDDRDSSFELFRHEAITLRSNATGNPRIVSTAFRSTWAAGGGS